MEQEDKTPRGKETSRRSGDDPAFSTEAMLSKLKEAHEIDSFLEENRDAFYSSTIRDYFEMLFEKYGISKKDAIERSNIERGYAYQILRGEKCAGRDKYLRLAVGIGLTLDDTQRLLTITQNGILYSKVLRDAILIFGINNHFDIIKLESLLEEKHADPLE